jgi:hypothetical protein
MSVVPPIIELTKKKDKLMRKPRMNTVEKRFETLITKFVFVEDGGRLVDSPNWKMLNKETQDAYLTLIATKTR